MKRRNFIAALAAFAVAPKIAPAAQPEIGSFRAKFIPLVGDAPHGTVIRHVSQPESQLTNAKLDEIYQMLMKEASQTWDRRLRESYLKLSQSAQYTLVTHPKYVPARY